MKVLERIKAVRGFDTISNALRDLIRFANVFFDPRLTVSKALKPGMLAGLLESEKFRREVAICDIIKSVPQLEKELGIYRESNRRI